MGTIIQASASFTRPADTTAYAANELVANSATAGSVTPMSFVVPTGLGRGWRITGVKIAKSGTTATNGNFHLRMYKASPTVANGDNGAWSSNKVADYIGKIDPAIVEAFTDGCAIYEAIAAPLPFYLESTSVIYGLLVADAAYTPASAEVFTVTLSLESMC